MNALSILKANLVGTKMPLFKTSDGHFYRSAVDDGHWVDSVIVDVAYVDVDIDSSGCFQSYPYYIVTFDCGYEMELDLD